MSQWYCAHMHIQGEMVGKKGTAKLRRAGKKAGRRQQRRIRSHNRGVKDGLIYVPPTEKELEKEFHDAQSKRQDDEMWQELAYYDPFEEYERAEWDNILRYGSFGRDEDYPCMDDWPDPCFDY